MISAPPAPFNQAEAALSTTTSPPCPPSHGPDASADLPETTFSEVATSSTAPTSPNGEPSTTEGGDDASVGRSEWNTEDRDTVRLAAPGSGSQPVTWTAY